MNGLPPIIRIAYRDADGEFQLLETQEITRFGCIPAIGDILRDTLTELDQPYKVRRRVFIPMTGEPDIWWLIVDEMANDKEIEGIVAFDAEMRAEFKAIEEEDRQERLAAFKERMATMKPK
ncbi:MAG: hypothetical protein E5Y03_25050 [Mesorhizobium sp.]|uniref:hypothetical protein n=1 Tax=Mesorhizobium sp. TaxID=1871066 RepID=UPI00121D82C2|nr:hypothetical protein [Mesorhizobium sp.]TIN98299.1 MAG: hypothetical protein E5Y03_25050 [Mesorhizobium sp.]